MSFFRFKKILLLGSFFILGCSNSPTIVPKELPVGYVDQEYQVKIEVEKVIFTDTLFVDSNFDSALGLKLNKGVGIPPYVDNTITISGTPKKSGSYRVVIDGQTRNAYGSNVNFRKEYDLVIKNK
ncbi:hypothetical protein ABD624_07155 [Avibacterium paragallinarum]